MACIHKRKKAARDSRGVSVVWPLVCHGPTRRSSTTRATSVHASPSVKAEQILDVLVVLPSILFSLLTLSRLFRERWQVVLSTVFFFSSSANVDTTVVWRGNRTIATRRALHNICVVSKRGPREKHRARRCRPTLNVCRTTSATLPLFFFLRSRSGKRGRVSIDWMEKGEAKSESNKRTRMCVPIKSRHCAVARPRP